MRTLLSVVACGVLASTAGADDWPQWFGPKRDGVWRETGILDKFPEGGPKVLWRKPVGYGYAGAAVAGGRVFVTDFVPNAGKDLPENPFARANAPGLEHVYCLDAKTGEKIWAMDYQTEYTISYPGG